MGHPVDDSHEDLLGLEVPGGVDADAPVPELGPVADPDARQDHKLALEVVEIHELLSSRAVVKKRHLPLLFSLLINKNVYSKMALPKVTSSLKERLEGVPGAEVVVGGDGDVDLVAVVVPEKGDLQRVGLVGALRGDSDRLLCDVSNIFGILNPP